MFKNSILVTWRSMRSRPLIYVLNIFGLAIGIAGFMFILIYTNHELSYDKHHEDVENIYRINHIIKQPGQTNYVGAATFPRVGLALKEEFDQVVNSCRVTEVWGTAVTLVDNDPIERESMMLTEPSFLEIFNLDLIQGDPKTCLKHPYTCIISEEVAYQHFGSNDCIGKDLILKTNNGEVNYQITGIFKDTGPSHIAAPVYFSFASFLADLGYEQDRNWRWFDFVTYVKLKSNTDLEQLDEAFVPFIDKHGGERLGSKRIDFDLMPVLNIHLHSDVNQEISVNGDIKTIWFLMVLGGFIILIAWINYLNLYTAKAIEKSKEVAIRKTLGSSKLSLIRQYLIEAGIVNFLAILLSILFLWGMYYLSVTFLDIEVPIRKSGLNILTWLVIMWIVSTFVSGTYPAVFISNFRILSALKGSSGVTGGGRLRKTLVIFQFMSAGFMIAGTLLVYQQLKFMNNMSTGINTSKTIVIDSPQMERDDERFLQKLNQLKQSFLQFNGVSEVAVTSDVPGKQVGWRGSSFLLNEEPQERRIVYKMTVGRDYLDYLDAEFLIGRNFETSSDSTNVIMNREAMNLYGFQDPEDIINRRIRYAGLDTLKVIGVIENFYQESLKERMKPTVYLMVNQELKYLSIRIDPAQTQEFIANAKPLFESTFPNVPFNWHSLDDLLEKRHKQESQFNKLFNAFAILTIFISFLGLLGLSYFTAEKRRKEVGVRKVLGSSVQDIIRLIFSDFAKLVLIGNLLAIPFLWFISNEWLAQFTKHISFPWFLPIATIGLTILMAFLFTVFHLLKLGRLNPVEVLKDE